MNAAIRVALAAATLLLGGCTTSSTSGSVAKAFLRVPSHYLGNLSVADRRHFLLATVGRNDFSILDGRNLLFRWDGEEPMGGEGPFTFHVFGPSARPTVGIFIERFYDKSTHIPPSTSLYILSRDHTGWSDFTWQVLPQPFDPRLYYEFLPSSDTLNVRAYTHSDRGYITPGRLLCVWKWERDHFTQVRK